MNISPSPVLNLLPPHLARPQQMAKIVQLQVSPAPRSPQSAYDSQRRCIHAAHLIASGASEMQIVAQAGLNPLQVKTVRQHHALV